MGGVVRKLCNSLLVLPDTEIKFLPCLKPRLMKDWYCLPDKPVLFSGISPKADLWARKSWQWITWGNLLTNGTHGPNAWSEKTNSVSFGNLLSRTLTLGGKTRYWSIYPIHLRNFCRIGRRKKYGCGDNTSTVCPLFFIPSASICANLGMLWELRKVGWTKKTIFNYEVIISLKIFAACIRVEYLTFFISYASPLRNNNVIGK